MSEDYFCAQCNVKLQELGEAGDRNPTDGDYCGEGPEQFHVWTKDRAFAKRLRGESNES